MSDAVTRMAVAVGAIDGVGPDLLRTWLLVADAKRSPSIVDPPFEGIDPLPLRLAPHRGFSTARGAGDF